MKRRCAGIALALTLMMGFLTGCARVGQVPSSPPTDGAAILSAIQQVLTENVARARPAVVGIVAYNVFPLNVPPEQRNKRIPRVDGTGFIFSPEGYIYTCAHVVHGATEVIVRLPNDEEVKAQITGTDPGTDIAVLKIPTDHPLPTLELGDSRQVRPGQFVIAIGNPFSLDFTATFGIVSATRRNLEEIAGYSRRATSSLIRYEDYIQTDAWINRGSSGGPLLDLQGRVVGMNAMIRAVKDGPASGPGFAIPSAMLVRIGRELREHGRVSRGWLGVGLQSHPKGVRLFRVLTGAPADKAGLRTGDIILKYNGQDIPDRTWLQRAIADTPAGTTVSLTVLRANQVEVIHVTLGEMPDKYTGRPQPVASSKLPSKNP